MERGGENVRRKEGENGRKKWEERGERRGDSLILYLACSADPLSRFLLNRSTLSACIQTFTAHVN